MTHGAGHFYPRRGVGIPERSDVVGHAPIIDAAKSVAEAPILVPELPGSEVLTPLSRAQTSNYLCRIPGMNEPPELHLNGHWRMAVWALRVGYLALAVAIAGLIVMSSGSTPWVLAVGVIGWLAAAAVTLTGFLWARHELPEPRPRYWSMRFMLIHDSVHALSSAQRS